MSYHRVCCCSPSPCVCTGCDFATSYRLGCITVSGSWNRIVKMHNLCTSPCYGSDEQVEDHEIDVVLSITIQQGTITRYGTSGCCYRRNGTANLTYSVTIRSFGACRNTTLEPCVTCQHASSWSGSREIDYCHVVTPVCVGGTVCSWAHTFSTCSTEIGTHDWVPQISPADCGGSPLDCDELPILSSKWVLGGAVMQWTTPYVALDTLTATDFTWIGYCPLHPWGCNPSASESDQDTDTQCMSYTAAQQVEGGPFALWLWSAGDPDQCAQNLNLAFSSWTNCDPSATPIQPCLGDNDYQSECCGNEFHFFAPDPPCYT